MDKGFIKTAAIVPNVKTADVNFNVGRITALLKKAAAQGVSIAVLPELCITGYTCGDLFLKQTLLKGALNGLAKIIGETKKLNLIFIVGLPLEAEGKLINAAAVIYKGEILGIVPKTYLPNYKEFYEQRWFASARDIKEPQINILGQDVPLGTDLLFKAQEATFGIEICEDLWAAVPPSCDMALNGAEIIFNLSASNELAAKHDYLKSLLAQQSARCICGYVYSSCGFGESSTDVVFAGNGLIYENGYLLNSAQRFRLEEQITISEIDIERIKNQRRENTTFTQSSSDNIAAFTVIETGYKASAPLKLTRAVNPLPFVPQDGNISARCREILDIQTAALAQRVNHTKAKSLVIGISGGLDSTLALMVAVRTFDKLNISRKNITAVTMPGFGTTGRTYNNAVKLMAALGVTSREIDIKPAVKQHFKDIGHKETVHDAVYENSQARERTQILMDIANQTCGLVVGTGDMSELALGWATYNGDHMSMYGVNAGIPKTLVQHLVAQTALEIEDKKIAAILQDIINTPISPELLPAAKNGKIQQKTEDLVGPYILHDFFLYYFLRFGFGPAKIYFLAQYAFKGAYESAEIKKWMKVFFERFFAQQFKRSCLPDGPKVGSIGISPRGDWRMPSDAQASLWIEELTELK